MGAPVPALRRRHVRLHLPLLALRRFSLPEQIFSVDAAAAAQAFTDNSDSIVMEGAEE